MTTRIDQPCCPDGLATTGHEPLAHLDALHLFSAHNPVTSSGSPTPKFLADYFPGQDFDG